MIYNDEIAISLEVVGVHDYARMYAFHYRIILRRYLYPVVFCYGVEFWVPFDSE